MTILALFQTHRPPADGRDGPALSIRLPYTSDDTPGHACWKMRARYELASGDDGWQLVVEDRPFFLSGQTWYRLLWTPPGDNAYYLLARPYIAARLSILSGVPAPFEVDLALTCAETFFATHTPASRLTPAVRDHAIACARALDDFTRDSASGRPQVEA